MSSRRCARTRAALIDRGGAGLSTWARWRVISHLRGCAACRDVLEQMRAVEAAGAAMASRRPRRREEALPDVIRRARRLRPGSVPRPTRPWRWRLLVAATVLPAVLIGAGLRERAVLHADAIIASVQDPGPTAVRRARLSIQPTTLGGAAVTSVEIAEDRLSRSVDEPPALARAISTIHLDPLRPLSPQPYRAWRAALRAPREEVARLTDGTLRVRTWAGQHAIRYGEMHVGGETPRVIGLVFVVDGIRLEIRETSYRPAPPAETVAVVGLQPERMERAEIAARMALHDAGADLAGHTTVSRLATGVRIGGHVTPAAYASVRARLAQVSDVQLELETRSAPALPSAALAAWLARVLPDSERPTFVPALHAQAASISGRLDSLQALSRRYPSEAVRRLPPDVRDQVEALIRDLYREMRSDLRALRPRLAVLAGAEYIGPVPDTSDLPPSDWRLRVASAVVPGRDLVRLTRAIMARQDLAPDGNDERADLRRAYADLRAALR